MGKVIIFRFMGGCRDGQESRSDEPNPHPPPAVNEATAFYALTESGVIGRRFKGLSPMSSDSIATGGNPVGATLHRYEVVSREEADDEVIVTVKYAPESED